MDEDLSRQGISSVKHLGSLGFPCVCDLHGVFRGDAETFVLTSSRSVGDLVRPRLFAISRPRARRADAPHRGTDLRCHPLIAWSRDLALRPLPREHRGGRGGQGQGRRLRPMGTLRRLVRDEARWKSSYQAPELRSSGNAGAFLADDFALGVTFSAVVVQDNPWARTKRGKCRLF